MRQLDEDFHVSGQIRPEDVPALAAQGIATIINNRPDGEAPGQPTAAEIGEAARAAGLDYVELPIAGLSRDVIEQSRAALATARRPVLAFCAAGTRSTFAWALAQAGERPAEELEEKAAAAGYDLTPVRRFL